MDDHQHAHGLRHSGLRDVVSRAANLFAGAAVPSSGVSIAVECVNNVAQFIATHAQTPTTVFVCACC